LTSSHLLGELEGGLLSLGDTVILLSSVEFNMAVGGEVGGDTTVGTVGSSATLLSALADGVGDDALVGVEALGLTVSLEVEEELTNGLDGLFGPSTSVGALILALSVSLSVELGEADDALVFHDALQVLDGFLNAHALDCSDDVVSVLEVSTEILDLSGGGLSGLSGGS